MNKEEARAGKRNAKAEVRQKWESLLEESREKPLDVEIFGLRK
jgi:hypothetical protein